MKGSRGRRGKHQQRGGNGGERPELIWGRHPVMELVTHAPQRVLEIILRQEAGPRLTALAEAVAGHGLPLRVDPRPFSGPLRREAHQGVLARVRPVPVLNLDAFIAGPAAADQAPIILALDGIEDPHNFGAMIRSAAAAGAGGIIFPKDRSAPLSGTVAKVSVGAINTLPLCRVTNMSAALARLKDQGFWIYGAHGGDDAAPIYDTDLNGPICLVIGSEHKGIRPLVKKHCDALISIPMPGGTESLNAAMAATIILFEAVRQRRAPAG